MKQLWKKKKFYILITLFLFLIMISSTLLETNILGNTYRYFTSQSYQNTIMTQFNTNNFLNGLLITIKETWHNFDWKYDYIMIWATNIFQLLLPFFAIIGAIFYKEKKKDIKNIGKVSFHLAFHIFLAYLLFYILIIILCKGQQTTYITRELWNDILGQNFYQKYTILYFFLEGCIRFFLMPFIYIMSGILLSQSFIKKQTVYYYIIILYFGISMISNIGVYLINPNFIYASPLTIMIAGTYFNISTPLILILNSIPLILSLILFYKRRNI